MKGSCWEVGAYAMEHAVRASPSVSAKTVFAECDTIFYWQFMVPLSTSVPSYTNKTNQFKSGILHHSRIL